MVLLRTEKDTGAPRAGFPVSDECRDREMGVDHAHQSKGGESL